MIRGLYEAATGMMARLEAQDVLANNLANASTSGFQRAIAAVQLQHAAGASGAAGSIPGGHPAQVLKAVTIPDISQGALQHTGASTDVALDGPGYMVARTARGNRLVRGGTLHATAKGELATQSGDPLLGTDGNAIRVGDKPWEIRQDGMVVVGGINVGRLKLVEATGPVRREGALLVSAGGTRDAPAGKVHVVQGALEHANVNPVHEMVDMIAGMRAYETAQRAITTQDGTLEKLLTILQR